MTGLTLPDGLPFAYQPDFADVQQWFELAMRVDALAAAADAQFQTIYKPKAFLARVSSNVASFNGPWSNLVRDWDTSGGTWVTGGWNQNAGEPQSWWLIGSDLMLSVTAGAPAATDQLTNGFTYTSRDPVSGAPLTLGTTIDSFHGYTLNQETSSGGESMSSVTVLPLYRGLVTPWSPQYPTGAVTYSMLASSRFWGIRLGPVSV